LAKRVVALLLILSLVASARAEDIYQLYKLPQGQRITTGEATYQCYGLEGFKDLLRLDNDLRLAEASSASQLKISDEFSSQIVLLEQARALEAQKGLLLSNRLTEKNTALEETTASYLQLASKLERRKKVARWLGTVGGALVLGLVAGVWIAQPARP
jgi:hypothetical protein